MSNNSKEYVLNGHNITVEAGVVPLQVFSRVMVSFYTQKMKNEPFTLEDKKMFALILLGGHYECISMNTSDAAMLEILAPSYAATYFMVDYSGKKVAFVKRDSFEKIVKMCKDNDLKIAYESKVIITNPDEPNIKDVYVEIEK